MIYRELFAPHLFKMLALLWLSNIATSNCWAEVYLTKTQALELVLGDDTQQIYDPQPLGSSLYAELLRQGLLGRKTKQAHFFKAKKDGQITAYALIDSEIGKHLPMTYIVGISPSGQITRVELMVFREVRGWEVRERRFMRQFEQKDQKDQVRIGPELRSVSGATLSCRAMAKGIRRALFLWNHFYADSSQTLTTPSEEK